MSDHDLIPQLTALLDELNVTVKNTMALVESGKCSPGQAAYYAGVKSASEDIRNKLCAIIAQHMVGHTTPPVD